MPKRYGALQLLQVCQKGRHHTQSSLASVALDPIPLEFLKEYYISKVQVKNQ